MQNVKIEELDSNSDDDLYATPRSDQDTEGSEAAGQDFATPRSDADTGSPPQKGALSPALKDSDKSAAGTLKPIATGQAAAAKEESDDEALTAEEQKALEKAEELKTQGNEFFKQEKFLESIEAYKEAVKVAPMKAQTEKAVYHCNASQSYIKLEQFQDAVREATSCLKLRPNNAIKMKALLRRAQSYEELKEVMRAYPDYEKLAMYDPKNQHYASSVKRLRPVMEAEQEKTKEEMLAKLKDLGNTVLGKFGMSLENFKAEKDPVTGQYSISMKQ